ncbi:UDP-glucose 4-epimerase GalE [Peredibacter starrii]|uniref:UDP-glucose 4-epimerase n=1 Tax=Peredibacter starrii TaxID=28202 RepID=A0AAX4HR58_9BACT|nr:UDP-glucose 4-epimerase GalE [Peredibacter starrii]WPU65863.1 UDP-glucose 4-epimerase GalE [Peredibacter starrii]
MKILITGGAGYIGSHVVKALGQLGYDITVFDNLSTGHREAVTYGDLVVGDLSDKAKLDELFKTRKFEAVLHFAGSIVVPDSVSDPLGYYLNNTVNSHFLLSLCQKYGVNQFIFSSTAAVYGMPGDGVCREDSPLAPINPYGQSKLMTEHMLKDLSFASNFRYVALRYFNVSGADPEGRIGQSFPKATHLIKVASETACGKREKMDIFGTDYATPDGTCVRDYIHVTDLADAHVKALEYLAKGGKSEVLNCGYGHGFSVKEVIARVKEITGVSFTVVEGPRRPGDPASLTAKADRIQQVIGWKPKYDDLNVIIKSAYEWEKKRPF